MSINTFLNTFFMIAAAAAGGALLAWMLARRGLLRLGREKHSLLTDQAVLQERLASRHEKVGELEKVLQGVIEENRRLQTDNNELVVAKKQVEAQLVLLQEARAELFASFKALSAEIYRSNSESFLQIAKSTLSHFQERAKDDLNQRKEAINDLVKPLQDSLQKVDVHVRQLEKERIAAYTSLAEQVKSMAMSQTRLQGETANLARALRTPVARGRWGEMQLRRVVEMAGMLAYCDFVEQQTAGCGRI